MKALLIFGQKFGQDNQPLMELGRKIAAAGNSVTFAHWDEPIPTIPFEESTIIIGHSFGGARAVNLSESYLVLKCPPVLYLALIDPVDPKWWPVGFSHYWKRFDIPSNVQRADCFTRAFNLIPPAGTIGNTSAYNCIYSGIPSNHASMPNHSKVVSTILKSLEVIAGNH